MVFLHGIVLFVIFHNTMRYVKQFGNKYDPYTVGTLILLALSTLALFINLPWMIISIIDDDSLSNWVSDNR